ncbi:hypothetical protein Hanom_Chr08g00695371 [Helianthus anomalus]
MGVLTNEGRRISEEVCISYKDKVFRVWVHEEEGEWVPEWISWSGSVVEGIPKEKTKSSPEKMSGDRFSVTDGDQMES